MKEPVKWNKRRWSSTSRLKQNIEPITSSNLHTVHSLKTLKLETEHISSCWGPPGIIRSICWVFRFMTDRAMLYAAIFDTFTSFQINIINVKKNLTKMTTLFKHSQIVQVILLCMCEIRKTKSQLVHCYHMLISININKNNKLRDVSHWRTE